MEQLLGLAQDEIKLNWVLSETFLLLSKAMGLMGDSGVPCVVLMHRASGSTVLNPGTSWVWHLVAQLRLGLAWEAVRTQMEFEEETGIPEQRTVGQNLKGWRECDLQGAASS